ncbi:MAG: TonB-dependent receptor plug domain-containing protein, partial [Gammaproteobacteria bacterium]
YVDVSGVYGRHSVDYFMRHTLNPQLLALTEEGITVANIPTDYNPGAYTQTDYSINLDLSRSLELGFASPVNVAFGGEHRQEKFKVTQGGRNSWYQDLESGGLSEQGFGVGSNGFTGFGPRLAGTWSRNSYAGYIDVEAEVVPGITFGAAGRYEDHEDVGNTADFKFSGRWQAADTFAVRGAVSTGFRAPTPGQANILNITTAFTAGVLADEATLPPTHPASLLLGGKALTPEESTNFTGGMVFNMGDLDVTFDYFHIKVKDRIARSGAQDLTPAQTQTLKDQGVAGADALTSVRFYTNDFDTVTQGIDIVATYPMEMFGGNTIFNFAANWTKTEVDSRDPFVDINGDPILTDAGEIQYAIDDKRVIQLERNLPRIRFTGTASHRNGPWDFTTRLRFYGKFTEFSTDSGGARLDAGSRALIDIEASYTWNDNLTFILGADNVFDTHPTDQSNNASPYVSGQEYAETSPYGFNGGFYYLRAIWQY